MTQETLKNLLPKFLDSLKTKGRSPATILAYKADLEQLSEFADSKGRIGLEQITQDLIEAFRDNLLRNKYTPKSVSRKLNAVKTFFRYLMTENHIAKDPSHSVAHPKLEVSSPKYLSQMEYRALRDVVRDDPRIAAMVELFLQTGMRISEAATLKMTNLKDGKVTIDAYATQPERTIPLNKKAKEALDNYLSSRPETKSEVVFISKSGKPLAVRNIRASIDRFLTKSEINGFSVNDLRTTFMVQNLKGGVDIVLLSQIAGHKRISTTERYLELAGIDAPGKKPTLEEL